MTPPPRVAMGMAVFVLWTASARADDRTVRTVRVGPVLGVGGSMVADETDTWDKLAIGYSIGASVTGPVAGPLHWRAELIYSARGARGSMGQEPARLDMTYLELPLLAEIRIASGSTVRPRAVAGLAVGRNLSSSFDSDLRVATDGGVGSPLVELEWEPPIRDWSISAVAGAGVGFDVGQQRVAVELRFLHGLQNLYDWSEGEQPFTNLGTVQEPIEADTVSFPVVRERSLSIISTILF